MMERKSVTFIRDSQIQDVNAASVSNGNCIDLDNDWCNMAMPMHTLGPANIGLGITISPSRFQSSNGFTWHDRHLRDDNSSLKNQLVASLRRFMNRRAAPGQAYVPTDIEHVANVVTHGLWIMPSLIGLLWMLYLASTPLQFRTSLVYGFALLALFTVSTIFHSICYAGKCGTVKEFFHIGDRAIIYLFIAASYTPWLTLKDFHGWQEFMLWTVWIAAVLGILYQYSFHEQFKWLETFLYVVIGVCPAIVVLAMKDHTGLYEMSVGGLAYIIGIPFFKSDGVIPCAHAIWHCFVFVGAVLHYCAVCKYLLGATTVFVT